MSDQAWWDSVDRTLSDGAGKGGGGGSIRICHVTLVLAIKQCSYPEGLSVKCNSKWQVVSVLITPSILYLLRE